MSREGGGRGDTWRRKRLGPSYLIGADLRQIRVGKEKEPVGVIRLLEDVKAGDQIILTRREVRFMSIGMEYYHRK